MTDKPNILFVFGDQWRAQATGYAGNPDVRTPHLDQLAARSVNFPLAISGVPVCSPARASYLTGKRPLTHGVFLNDVNLAQDTDSMARVFGRAGYDTAWIGKWHVDGHGRSAYIPPERRQGFQTFHALECTHDYLTSPYYADNDPTKRYWEGYDAFAQTEDACSYIRSHGKDKPFLLGLSWGPPHSPWPTPQRAPKPYRELYDPEALRLRENVPAECEEHIRDYLLDYYGHCTALDACMARLREALWEAGLDENTIIIFTSDHGDMLDSHGQGDKQRPWDEAIRVPFLVHWPAGLGNEPKTLWAPIDCPDVLPTLLGLCGLEIPESMEGLDFSGHIRGGEDPGGGAAVISCPHPFGNWNRSQQGGREYRGLRTRRYTYVRTLEGPWLLYDNEADPYQLHNRVDDPAWAELRAQLDSELTRRLEARGDAFLPGQEYLDRWGYETDQRGTVGFEW